MAVIRNSDEVTYKSGEDMSGGQYLFVVQTDKDTVELADALSDVCRGVQTNIPGSTIGETVSVKVAGEAFVRAAEAIAIGAYVSPNASGLAQVTVTASQKPWGICVVAAGAAGDLAVIELFQTGSMEGNLIADPGNAGAIPVVHKDAFCALTSAGAETRTLAIPTAVGQKLRLWCDTYVGDIVLTVAAAVNVANNNTLTFGAASEFISLVGVSVGGALVWQIEANDGVGLTTV